MYNNQLFLISYEIATDDIGNEIRTPIQTAVLCKVKDIGSTEFYNAQVNGLKPEIKFTIHSFEYEGQQEVEYNNEKYKVIRTYQGGTVDRSDNSINNEEIEITCEKVISNG